MFPEAGPSANASFTTSAMNQQNNALLGNPQIQQQGTMPAFDPSALNSTAFQSNSNAANMVKALKGSA